MRGFDGKWGGNWGGWLDVPICFGLIAFYSWSLVPGVNESHYWVKAAHYWDPTLWEGDLFAQSADAHWFFFVTMGVLTKWFPLPLAVWVARGICWGALAASWSWLARSVVLHPLAGALCLPVFASALERGHLSGEWVLGGVESKGMAYACLFMGLSHLARGQWKAVWIWFGLASAFHVIVGGWVTLAAMILVVFFPLKFVRSSPTGGELTRSRIASRIKEHLPWLLGGGSIALLGLVPALSMNPSVSGKELDHAYWLYVYHRLPHHLSPMNMSLERWWMHGQWMICVLLVALMLARTECYRPRKLSEPSRGLAQGADMERLWMLALAGTGFAIVGILVDALFCASQPALAARWLRFYWLRWHDVAWPIVVSLTLLWIAFHSVRFVTWARGVAWFSLLVPPLVLAGGPWQRIQNSVASPADMASLYSAEESAETNAAVLADWGSVCDWIVRSTEPSDLFVTPRHQQTFKWNTHRGELVCWKDAPQDARHLLEWESRLKETAQWSWGELVFHNWRPWLQELRRKYGVRYAVIDRRREPRGPKGTIVYPLAGEDNTTYYVVQIDEPEE